MKTILVTLVAFTLVGCSQQIESNTDVEPSSPIVKISVFQSGKILIDGTEATMVQVESRLAKLKSEDGAVWYYREDGQEEPPPEAMQIIKFVVDNGLPISLSTKPDFSDIVDENGQSRPRE